MKNFIYILLISVVAFSACDYEDERLDMLTENAVPSFVRFDENTADTVSFSEDFEDTLSYSVDLGIRIYDDAVYRVNLEGDAVYGTDYRIINDTDLSADGDPIATFDLADDFSYLDISFPRNDTASLSRIGVILMHDEVNDGEKTLTLELDTAYGLEYGPLQIGRGPYGEQRTVKMIDIDCAIDYDLFADKEVTITEAGDPDFVYSSTLKATETPGTYIIENFGDWGVDTQVKLVLDDAYDVTIPGDPQPGLVTAIGNAFGVDLSGAEVGYALGTGSFNTCPGSENISISFNYYRADDSALFADPSTAVITLK